MNFKKLLIIAFIFSFLLPDCFAIQAKANKPHSQSLTQHSVKHRKKINKNLKKKPVKKHPIQKKKPNKQFKKKSNYSHFKKKSAVKIIKKTPQKSHLGQIRKKNLPIHHTQPKKKFVNNKKIVTQKKKFIKRKPMKVKIFNKVNQANITPSILPGYLLNTKEKSLINFVRNTITSIQYTAYKLGGTKIDTNRGIYIVDCSRYVDHILKNIYPGAFTSLTAWSGTERPTTYDFYHYFTNLSDDSEHWNSINDVEKLRPGDILVFRNKNRGSGHVMIVMDKPLKEGNTFLIRIADSAPSGHSKDTRMPHASGIGIGSMLLKVNPRTFQPYAYAWKVGSRWENNVNFAMARPNLKQ